MTPHIRNTHTTGERHKIRKLYKLKETNKQKKKKKETINQLLDVCATLIVNKARLMRESTTLVRRRVRTKSRESVPFSELVSTTCSLSDSVLLMRSACAATNH